MPNTIEALKPIADYTDGGGHWTNYLAPKAEDGDDVLVCYLDGRPYFRRTLAPERFDRSWLVKNRPADFADDMWQDFGVGDRHVLFDTVGEYVEIDGELLQLGGGDYFHDSLTPWIVGLPVTTRGDRSGVIVEVRDDRLVLDTGDGNRAVVRNADVTIVEG
jgi:hypothetical protein